MRFLYNKDTIYAAFLECMEKYDEYYWITAIASGEGGNNPLYNKLIQNEKKIKKLLIGLGYGFKNLTDPELVERFRDDERIVFLKQKTYGYLHAKVYWFYTNSNDWSLLIGSANFTASGLMNNHETILWMDNDSDTDNSILESMKDLFSDDSEDSFINKYSYMKASNKDIDHFIQRKIKENAKYKR